MNVDLAVPIIFRVYSIIDCENTLSTKDLDVIVIFFEDMKEDGMAVGRKLQANLGVQNRRQGATYDTW